MPKQCDHKSVGMIVEKEGKILLIERARKPFGFAIPAGHIDDDPDYETTARRELKEEVGLDARELELVGEGRKENPCRRDGGTWHYWKIYKVVCTGELSRSLDETKQSKWFSKEEINTLADRTREYLEGKITDEEWEKNPGLEIVMFEWFKELGLLN